MNIKTNYWNIFTTAESFGSSEIEKTFESNFKVCRNDYLSLSEFLMVLNCKIWQHHTANNRMLTKLYSLMWESVKKYAKLNFEKEEYDYIEQSVA